MRSERMGLRFVEFVRSDFQYLDKSGKRNGMLL